jgi:hypothetical protein
MLPSCGLVENNGKICNVTLFLNLMKSKNNLVSISCCAVTLKCHVVVLHCLLKIPTEDQSNIHIVKSLKIFKDV